MPLETQTIAPPEKEKRGISETITALSAAMLTLDPGPCGELRRMEAGRAAPAYWRLAATCGFLDGKADAWMRIVKIMAILTPKGERKDADRLHDPNRRLGAILCDGGDTSWPGDTRGAEPSPFLSERRLARFLAQHGTMQGETLERIARSLARSQAPDVGVNCVEIARLLLTPDDQKLSQAIARDYYRRLDAASRYAQNKDNRA
jgi:CRISPR system Cascade subunit CasB